MNIFLILQILDNGWWHASDYVRGQMKNINCKTRYDTKACNMWHIWPFQVSSFSYLWVYKKLFFHDLNNVIYWYSGNTSSILLITYRDVWIIKIFQNMVRNFVKQIVWNYFLCARKVKMKCLINHFSRGLIIIPDEIHFLSIV